jgi:hypothetical protein
MSELDCYCTGKDILISENEYANCMGCNICKTHSFLCDLCRLTLCDYENEMKILVKKHLRINKLKRIL